MAACKVGTAHHVRERGFLDLLQSVLHIAVPAAAIVARCMRACSAPGAYVRSRSEGWAGAAARRELRGARR